MESQHRNKKKRESNSGVLNSVYYCLMHSTTKPKTCLPWPARLEVSLYEAWGWTSLATKRYGTHPTPWWGSVASHSLACLPLSPTWSQNEARWLWKVIKTFFQVKSFTLPTVGFSWENYVTMHEQYENKSINNILLRSLSAPVLICLSWLPLLSSGPHSIQEGVRAQIGERATLPKVTKREFNLTIKILVDLLFSSPSLETINVSMWINVILR